MHGTLDGTILDTNLVSLIADRMDKVSVEDINTGGPKSDTGISHCIL